MTLNSSYVVILSHFNYKDFFLQDNSFYITNFAGTPHKCMVVFMFL